MHLITSTLIEVLTPKRNSNAAIVIAFVSTAIMLGAADSTCFAAAAEGENPTAKENSPQLLLIRSKGKYGLIDRAGNLILKPQYDSLIASDSSNSARFEEYLDINYSEGLRPAQIDQKWGYIDKDGNEILPPQYLRAGPFHEGWAQVCVTKQGRGERPDASAWGVIDREGKFVIDPQYSFIGPFRDGFARVAVGGTQIEGGFPRSKWGFINKKGEQILPTTFDYAHNFSHGRALVNIGGRWRGGSGLSFYGGQWGVIDESGKFVAKPKIEIAAPQEFHDPEPTDEADLLPVKYDGKFGYRDQHWNFAIEPQFDEALPFNEDLAAVKQSGKFGYIDTTGQWAIKPRFQAAGAFSEGLAPVVTEKGVRFIDKTGKEILEVAGDEARPFDAGLAAVRVGKLWGIIDRQGQFLHKPQFKEVDGQDRDFYYIQNSDGLRGLMNRQGEIVVQPKYGFIGGFQKNGFAMIDMEPLGLPDEFWLIDRKGNFVPGPMSPTSENAPHKLAFLPKRIDDKWGIVDGAGELVIASRFGGIQTLGEGMLGVEERSKWGMVNLENGKLIIEPTYYSIRHFSEGLAETRPSPSDSPTGDAQWVGYIDRTGKLVIPYKFASGSCFENGIAQVSVLYNGDADSYYIDKEGRFLWHPDQR